MYWEKMKRQKKKKEQDRWAEKKSEKHKKGNRKSLKITQR